MRAKLWPVSLGCAVAGLSALALVGEFRLAPGGAAERWFEEWLARGDDVAEKGRQQLWAGNLDGPGGAIDILRAALRRDPASPYRWCDLGEALFAAGRAGEAAQCIVRAAELGPKMPPVLMRAVNFYLRADRPKEALPYAARVLALVADYDDVIFSSYDRFEISVPAVLSAGVPALERAAHSYFRHLVSIGRPGDLKLAWDWLRERRLASEALAKDYSAFLVRARDYDGAVSIWSVDHPRPGPSHALFEERFERQPAGALFGWTLYDVAGARATVEPPSLRLDFDATQNVAYGHLTQKAVVAPGAYVFRARVRSSAISTDQGLGFRIYDAESPPRLSVATARVTGTVASQVLECAVPVPNGTRLVEVRLTREASWKFDNKLSGTFWIDSVELLRK